MIFLQDIKMIEGIYLLPVNIFCFIVRNTKIPLFVHIWMYSTNTHKELLEYSTHINNICSCNAISLSLVLMLCIFSGRTNRTSYAQNAMYGRSIKAILPNVRPKHCWHNINIVDISAHILFLQDGPFAATVQVGASLILCFLEIYTDKSDTSLSFSHLELIVPFDIWFIHFFVPLFTSIYWCFFILVLSVIIELLIIWEDDLIFFCCLKTAIHQKPYFA